VDAESPVENEIRRVVRLTGLDEYVFRLKLQHGAGVDQALDRFQGDLAEELDSAKLIFVQIRKGSVHSVPLPAGLREAPGLVRSGRVHPRKRKRSVRRTTYHAIKKRVQPVKDVAKEPLPPSVPQ